MKYPWIQFFATDWLNDPAVSMCEPATRGIWVDWICNMHLLDRSGQITGTREQLARAGRCTAVQVESALQDLKATKAADCTERNGVVTVVNRRMQRESKSRENTRERVTNHRRNGAVTAHSHKSEVISQNQTTGLKRAPELDWEQFNRMRVAVCGLLGRASQRLNHLEESTLAEIARRAESEEEFKVLAAFKEKPESFFPASVESLLTNWDKTLDRARNYDGSRRVNTKPKNGGGNL